jgi:hypothetical protein
MAKYSEDLSVGTWDKHGGKLLGEAHQHVVLRQEHEAGEKLFVDRAGTTIPIYDPRGGPMQQAHLFVAVLGASS